MTTAAEDSTAPSVAMPRFVVAAIRSEGLILYQEYGGAVTTNASTPSASRFNDLLEEHVSRYERAWQVLADS